MNPNRHARDCRICRHPRREQIERESGCGRCRCHKLLRPIVWNRSTVYLHASSFGPSSKRARKIAKSALANFIERCNRVRPSAAALVSACVALSKINAEGQTIDRVSVSSLNHAFDRFTRGELERFAAEGVLPEWYREAVSETPNASEERVQ